MKIRPFIAMTINDYYLHTLLHIIMLLSYGWNKKNMPHPTSNVFWTIHKDEWRNWDLLNVLMIVVIVYYSKPTKRWVQHNSWFYWVS